MKNKAENPHRDPILQFVTFYKEDELDRVEREIDDEKIVRRYQKQAD